MSEVKNKVIIANQFYYVFVITLSIYSLLRNTFYAIATVNPEGFIPIVMAAFLLWLIWKKSQYTAIALIGWSLYFILKYGIVFFGLLLAYAHNGFKDVSILIVLEKLAFMMAGVIIWIGAHLYVEIHEEVAE